MSPYKPMKPCGHRGCPSLTSGWLCEIHEEEYKRAKDREYNKQRGSSAQQGYGRNHRRLRLIVLAEEPICRKCRKAPSTQMDHIDGDNINLSRDNLQGLCSSCHATKTFEEQNRWGGRDKSP